MSLRTNFDSAYASLQQSIHEKRWDKVFLQVEALLMVVNHLQLTECLATDWQETLHHFTTCCLNILPELYHKAACRQMTELLISWLDVLNTLPGIEGSLKTKLVASYKTLSLNRYDTLSSKWPSLDKLLTDKDAILASLHKVVRSPQFTAELAISAYLDTLVPYYLGLMAQQSERIKLTTHPLQPYLIWLTSQSLDESDWGHLLRYYYELRRYHTLEVGERPGYDDSLLQLQGYVLSLVAINNKLTRKLQAQRLANPGSRQKLPDSAPQLLVDETVLLAILQACLVPTTNAISAIPVVYNHQRVLLQAARQSFALSQQNIELFAAQKHFSEQSLGLLNQLLDESITLLGEPPCAIALLALGSSSRLDRMTYSDIELALLYEPHPQQSPSFCKLYVAYVLRLLELKIVCLGETPLGLEALQQGFYLDSSSPLLAGKLWGTVEEVFSEVVKQSLIQHPLGEPEAGYTLDHSLYSLLQPMLVNTAYNGEGLFKAYGMKVGELLKSVPEQAALLQAKISAIPIIPYQQYLGFYVWQNILSEANGHSEVFNIKDKLHKPLVYLALALKLSYGLDETHPADIFNQAASQGLVEHGFANYCQAMLVWSVDLRNQLHLQAQSQKEGLNIDALPLDKQQCLTYFLETVLPIWQEAMHLYWRQRQAKDDSSFTDCIKQTLLNWLSQADTLEQNFTRITYYLLYTQADLALHRYFYRQLPVSSRARVLAQLNVTVSQWQDKSLWPEADFIQRLWHGPDEAGNRPSHTNTLRVWQQTLAEWTTTTEQSLAQVYSPLVGMCYLKPSLVNQLVEQGWLSSSGQFVKKANHKIAKAMAGNHLVVPLPDKEPTLYLKVFPEYPLMELFLNDLQRRLGNAASREVDLWYWRSGKFDYPILASQAVQGEALHKRLQANPRLTLDSASFSAQILVAALVNFEDAKPDNFIVMDTPTGAKLIAIDNDRWFVPAFQNGKLNAKNILFCFDEMDAPLDAVVREELLNLNPKALLAEWLAHLKNWGEMYQGIFGKKIQAFYQPPGLFTKGMVERSMILPPLPPHAVYDLYNHLQKLQDLLTHHPQATHWQVLACLNPRLANHYQGVMHQYNSPLQRFEAAAGQAYQRNPHSHEYLSTKIDFKTHASLLWTHLPNKFELIQTWQRDIALAQGQLTALTENPQQIQVALQQLREGQLERFTHLSLLSQQQLLKELDWGLLTLAQQRELINYLKTQNTYQKLIIRGSVELKDADVRQLLTQHTALKSLTLHACPSISFEALKLLSSCQQLKRLVLSQLPQLRDLGYLAESGYILAHSAIEQLTIRDCSQLEFIIIKTQALRKLKVSYCPMLTTLRSESPELELLSLDNCQAIKLIKTGSKKLITLELLHCEILQEQGLSELCQSSQSLTQVSIKNCQALVFAEQRAAHPLLLTLPLAHQTPEWVALAIGCLTQTATSLNLMGKKFDPALDTDSLLLFLKSHSGLTEVILPSKNFEPEQLQNLITALGNQRALQTLNLARNELSDGLVAGLFTLLQVNPALKHLNLSWCKLNSTQLENLLPALSLLTQLETLDLENNLLTDAITSLFASLILAAPRLTMLDLSFNEIGDEGVIVLAAALQANNVLTKLGLRGNRIGDRGLQALIHWVEENTTLVELDVSLSSKPMTPALTERLAQRLSQINQAQASLQQPGYGAFFAVPTNTSSIEDSEPPVMRHLF